VEYSIAPPIPWRNLQARSRDAEGEKKARSDAKVYTRVPVENTLALPVMSPSIPAGSRKIAEERRYAAGIQESIMASMANSSPMRGRARLMLEPVNGLRNVPMVTMTRTTPRELLFAGSDIRKPPETRHKKTSTRDEPCVSAFINLYQNV